MRKSWSDAGVLLEEEERRETRRERRADPGDAHGDVFPVMGGRDDVEAFFSRLRFVGLGERLVAPTLLLVGVMLGAAVLLADTVGPLRERRKLMLLVLVGELVLLLLDVVVGRCTRHLTLLFVCLFVAGVDCLMVWAGFDKRTSVLVCVCVCVLWRRLVVVCLFCCERR